MAIPLLSVVIATVGRPEMLRRTLRSLTYQDEKRFEVIVIADGGPYEEIERVVGPFSAVLDVHLSGTPVCLGAARARNRGIAAAVAPRVLFVDDDCLCPPSLVGAHVWFDVLESMRHTGVIGLRRHLSSAVYEGMTEEQFRHPELLPFRAEVRNGERLRRSMDHARWDQRAWQFTWTCHLSAPRAALEYVGGFWTDMKGSGHEDRELGLRLCRAGTRWVVLAGPCVYHQDHPKCKMQTQHATRNRELLRETINDTRIVIRNGGHLV